MTIASSSARPGAWREVLGERHEAKRRSGGSSRRARHHRASTPADRNAIAADSSACHPHLGECAGVGSTLLDSLGTTFPDGWVEFDVGQVAGAPGTHCFGLSSSSSNSVIYSSREGSHPPELVVSTGVAVPALAASARAILVAALAATGAAALSQRAPRWPRGLGPRT